MKIIFDSEEQKDTFLATIFYDYCPSDIGLNDRDCDGSIGNDCTECWKRAIKMEVEE